MVNIPTEIIREILTRLPVKSLLRFRCIDNLWHSLIDDPDFIRLHLHRQSGNEQLLLRENCIGNWLYTLPLNSLNFNESQSIDATHVKASFNVTASEMHHYPLCCCDGLILLSHSKSIWSLWNPFTREVLELPAYRNDTRITRIEQVDVGEEWPVGGIGYDLVTDDYKVVRLERAGYDSWETSVYSLKLGYWRRVDYLLESWLLSRSAGVFFNGALYWIVYDKNLPPRFVVFDLGTETYHLFPMPEAMVERKRCRRVLSALDGCLFMSCFFIDGWIDLWMTKDYYGEKGCWNKLFSLKKPDNSWFCWRTKVKPLAYVKNKEQVFFQCHNEFILFDVESKFAKKVTVAGITDNISVEALPASLVRLNLYPPKETTRKRKRDNDHRLSLVEDIPRTLNITLTTADFQFPIRPSS